MLALSFLFLQALILLTPPRLPYADMSAEKSSCLLALDMSGDSTHLTSVQNRSKNRQTAGVFDSFDDLDVSTAADFSDGSQETDSPRQDAENFDLMPVPRFNIVSRK
jgi:hypothetical protein